MKRKFVTLVAFVFLGFVSCKKEDSAISKIDTNSQEIAPANPEAKIEAPQNNPSVQQVNSPQVNQQQIQPVENKKLAAMRFNKIEHDFGTINQGDKVNYTFSFTNTGKNDLIISNAVGSCGCTVPEYPKEPIKPGKQGKMKVSFDSTGKSGMQSKTVTVNANTPSGTEKLTIKANIVVPEAKQPTFSVTPSKETTNNNQ